MLASLVAWSAVAAATPLVGAAPAGSVFPLLVGARAALGLAQSCLMPATSAMAAQYAPGAAAAAFQTPLNGRAGPSRSPASCPPPPPWPPIARPGPPRPRPSLRSFAALGLVPPSCPVLAAHRHAYVRSTTSVVLGGCPGRGPAPRSARAHALRGAARWVQPGAGARARAGGHLRGSVCGHGGGHAADTAAAVARRAARLLGRGACVGGAPPFWFRAACARRRHACSHRCIPLLSQGWCGRRAARPLSALPCARREATPLQAAA